MNIRDEIMAAAREYWDSIDDDKIRVRHLRDFALSQMWPREARIAELERWRLALESLTPQGSEFVNDLDTCMAYIEKRRQSEHQMLVKAAREKKELERQLAVADSAMHEMLRCFGDQRTQCTNEYLDAVNGIGNALAQIRGGAAGKFDEAEVRGCITKNE